MANRRRPVPANIGSQLNEALEWRDLTQADLQSVEKEAICRDYEMGEVIFSENDQCRGVYFVSSGLIGVRKTSADGESTLLKLVYPGETLGYRPMVAQQRHRATAEVLKPGMVCFIRSATVLPMIQNNPALGLSFLQRATAELGEAEERYHETVTLTLRARFAHLLMLWKDRYGQETADGKLVLEIPVSRADLADMLGVRRESVSRVIHELEADGITHFVDRRVEISNANHLLDEFRIE